MFYLDKKEFLMSPRVLRRLGVLAGLLVLAAVIPWSRETISGEAVIQPIRTLRVEAPEDGVVVRTVVREGDRVQKGQPLLEMSSSGLAQELGALTAEEIGLRGQESAGIAEDDPRAAFQAGETGRAVAAELVRDRSRRERLLLRSPVSGAVLTPSVDELAGKFVHAGATLLEVGDARQFKAEIPVTERLVTQIPLGTPVTVQLRARPLTLLHGTVASVSAAAEGASDTAAREEKGLLPSDIPEKFTVVATFPGSENDLVTGMKGNAKIYLRRRSFVGRGWLILKHWVDRIVW
jgi:multidrug efflux pump subunit AcrA (membrane-fusion protein)